MFNGVFCMGKDQVLLMGPRKSLGWGGGGGGGLFCCLKNHYDFSFFGYLCHSNRNIPTNITKVQASLPVFLNPLLVLRNHKKKGAKRIKLTSHTRKQMLLLTKS